MGTEIDDSNRKPSNSTLVTPIVVLKKTFLSLAMAEDNSSDFDRKVEYVSIYPSKFSKEKPIIWFIQIEAPFATNGIM